MHEVRKVDAASLFEKERIAESVTVVVAAAQMAAQTVVMKWRASQPPRQPSSDRIFDALTNPQVLDNVMADQLALSLLKKAAEHVEAEHRNSLGKGIEELERLRNS